MAQRFESGACNMGMNDEWVIASLDMQEGMRKLKYLKRCAPGRLF